MIDNIIQILGYNIKLYDNENKLLKTLKENELKSSVNFAEEINSGQQDLTLTIKTSDFNKIVDGLLLGDRVYSIKVYYVIKLNNFIEEKLLYTGVLDRITKKAGNSFETQLIFIGLWTLFSNIKSFGIDDYDVTTGPYFTGNNTISYTYNPYSFIGGTGDYSVYRLLTELLYQNVGFTIVNSSASTNLPHIGDKLIGNTTGFVSYVCYKNGTIGNFKLGFYRQNGKYNDNEVCQVWRGSDLMGWTNTGETITIIDYPEGDNFYNYFLNLIPNYDNTPILNNGFNQEFKDLKGIDILNNILNIVPNTFYYVNKNGELIYNYLDNTPTKTITFNQEVMELVKDEDYYDIVNALYITISDGTTYYFFNKDSIEKYGRRELDLNESTIQDYGTALMKANSFLDRKSGLKNSIVIKINLVNYIKEVERIMFQDLNSKFTNYTQQFLNFYAITVLSNTFDINIGDKISVRNLDFDNEISNVTLVRKEFDGNFMTLYLDNYNENYYRNVFSGNNVIIQRSF